MSVAPIEAVGSAAEVFAPLQAAPPAMGSHGVSFAELISTGVERVNDDLKTAEAMVKAFTLDDSIPVHQVTFALEQARLSVELMMHVRSRLLEGYQELMRMQL